MSSLVNSYNGRNTERVLPEHARVHNLNLVIRSLFHQGAMSRADLARETGLTRVTTSDLISQLIRENLVQELGFRAPSGPGKPAVLVDLDRSGIQVVGLDLSGADEYKGALMDLSGEVLARRTVPRGPEESSEQAQAAVLGLAQELVSTVQGRLLGVGVASPGVISPDGVVLEAPNFGWSGVALRESLQESLGVPVVVANDANAAALAEYTLGQSEPDLFLVRIGRGVGGALLVRGELVFGRDGAAGEIGHVPVGDGTDGPECACGKRGCLEAWISVPQLNAMLKTAADQDSVLREAGQRLGLTLAPIVAALNLSDVVLAAPPELFGGVLLDSALENLRTHTLGRLHTDVNIRLPHDGDDAVLRGALVLVLASELGIS